MHILVEQRISGWMTRALEINGGRDVKVEITSSLTKKQLFTEFALRWN